MALPVGRRIALDIGTVRVGVAATDLTGKFPSPRSAVAPSQLSSYLRELISEIAIIYVGMPKHLSGAEGHSANFAREMAGQLKAEFALPVQLVDERLTTKSAQERKKRDPNLASVDIDSIAALELLEFALVGEALKGEIFGEEL